MGWRDKPDDYPYVSFEDGPFTGTFINGEESKNKWGECVRFTFKDENGATKSDFRSLPFNFLLDTISIYVSSHIV